MNWAQTDTKHNISQPLVKQDSEYFGEHQKSWRISCRVVIFKQDWWCGF